MTNNEFQKTLQPFFKSSLLLLICLIAFFGSSAASGQSPVSTCTEPAQFIAMMQEVRSLRIELLQEKLHRSDALLAGLHHQLQAAKAEQEQIGARETSQTRELAELEQQLLQHGLTSQEQSELERQRSVVISAAPHLAGLAAAAAQREAELREQIRAQEQFRHQLLERLNALTGAL